MSNFVSPTPDIETAADPRKLFEWINENIFPGGVAYNDWRMEWAESYKYLKAVISQGDLVSERMGTGTFSLPARYEYKVRYNFAGLEGEFNTVAYSKRGDVKLHNSHIFGCIYHDIEGKLNA
jgi:hypothetical protein